MVPLEFLDCSFPIQWVTITATLTPRHHLRMNILALLEIFFSSNTHSRLFLTFNSSFTCTTSHTIFGNMDSYHCTTSQKIVLYDPDRPYIKRLLYVVNYRLEELEKAEKYYCCRLPKKKKNVKT